MPPWCPTTPYKGLFILVLAFVLLEYFFNTFTNSKIYNSNKLSRNAKEFQTYGPLLKTLLFKNNKTNLHNNTIIYTTKNESYYSYIVTEPSFSTNNLNSFPVTLSAISTSTIEIKNDSKLYNSTLPLCPDDISSSLDGRIPIIRSPVPSVEELENRFTWLQPGGHWQPPNCRVLKSVAIVIPFRCRGEHLLLFLQHMHPYLKKQQLDYTIFVIEQDGDGPFNRAMLMNIGYREALEIKWFDCFIFHDIDLLPEDDRNLYTCPEQPRHMSVAVNIFKYKLPYPAIFGGVSAISTDHFKLLNGFSNSFWGWGGEDDDMSNRIRYHHLHISRYPISIARYTMLTHKKDKPSPSRYDILKQGEQLYDKDGLNSLKYKRIQRKFNLLYTWVLVRIDSPS
ncbi:beta-1,4-N-acetylgalactosaminyltransferase bre-4 [Diorhabda sublineata]|uniref:beta-1,4-N-acetylgalactosaminyltransferase bre-4 n=1 Tax=Diorhabda sublineata TaxID=1163346 RepID=UPI0024E04355|nr:beta-1,4-N-acetylgalactosaminyltransferase bre-4 [Diorhabda sublineata]